MRLIIGLLVTALLAFAALSAEGAAADEAKLDLRRSMGNRRPGSHSVGGAAQGANRTIYVVPQPYYGGYGYPAYPGYDPYYSGGYGYHPHRYPYYRRPYVYPPIFVPVETLYGPRALKRFMGVGW